MSCDPSIPPFPPLLPQTELVLMILFTISADFVPTPSPTLFWGCLQGDEHPPVYSRGGESLSL